MSFFKSDDDSTAAGGPPEGDERVVSVAKLADEEAPAEDEVSEEGPRAET